MDLTEESRAAEQCSEQMNKQNIQDQQVQSISSIAQSTSLKVLNQTEECNQQNCQLSDSCSQPNCLQKNSKVIDQKVDGQCKQSSQLSSQNEQSNEIQQNQNKTLSTEIQKELEIMQAQQVDKSDQIQEIPFSQQLETGTSEFFENPKELPYEKSQNDSKMQQEVPINQNQIPQQKQEQNNDPIEQRHQLTNKSSLIQISSTGNGNENQPVRAVNIYQVENKNQIEITENEVQLQEKDNQSVNQSITVLTNQTVSEYMDLEQIPSYQQQEDKAQINEKSNKESCQSTNGKPKKIQEIIDAEQLQETELPKKRKYNDPKDSEITLKIRNAVKKMQEASKMKVLNEACKNFTAVKKHRDELLIRIAELDNNFAEWLLKVADEDQLPVLIEDSESEV